MAPRSQCVFVPGWDKAPDSPGVYMLYWGDICVYVGASSNLRARVKSHPYRKLCTRFRHIECTRDELQRVEQEQMDALRPTLNRAPASAPPQRRKEA